MSNYHKDSNNQIASIDFTNPDLYQDWVGEITTALNNPRIRYIFFIGGAGCGKSYLLTQLSVQANLAGENWYWFKKIGSTLKNSCFRSHKEVISSFDLHNTFEIQESMRIRNIFNDSEINFTGLDDPEKIKSVVSPDVIVMEEASDFNFQDFVQLNIRLRGKNNQKMIILSNKVSQKSWLKTKVLDTGNFNSSMTWIEKTVLDNRFADSQYVESLKALKDIDEEMYNIYFKNDWGETKRGLVYSKFQTFTHDLPYIDSIGLDFGYKHPSAMVYTLLQAPTKNEGPKHNLYVKQVMFRQDMIDNDYIEAFDLMGVSKETLIYADSSRPETIAAIALAGYKIIPVTKGAGSVSRGIRKVNSYSLHLQGVDIIREASNYCWKVDNSSEATEQVVKANDDLMDAMRYACQAYDDIYSDYNKKLQDNKTPLEGAGVDNGFYVF
jgi:phage terminase large subunit